MESKAEDPTVPSGLTLDQLQGAVDDWIRNRAGGYWDQFEMLARLTEEVGELASALQRERGLRPRKTEVSIPDEVGDVLFTLVAFANASGINLEETLKAVLRKYDVRDGQAWAQPDPKTELP